MSIEVPRPVWSDFEDESAHDDGLEFSTFSLNEAIQSAIERDHAYDDHIGIGVSFGPQDSSVAGFVQWRRSSATDYDSFEIRPIGPPGESTAEVCQRSRAAGLELIPGLEDYGLWYESSSIDFDRAIGLDTSTKGSREAMSPAEVRQEAFTLVWKTAVWAGAKHGHSFTVYPDMPSSAERRTVALEDAIDNYISHARSQLSDAIWCDPSLMRSADAEGAEEAALFNQSMMRALDALDSARARLSGLKDLESDGHSEMILMDFESLLEDLSEAKRIAIIGRHMEGFDRIVQGCEAAISHLQNEVRERSAAVQQD